MREVRHKSGRALWPVFNLIVFAGFIASGFSIKRFFPDMNAALIVSFMAVIYVAASLLTNLLHQLGHVFAARLYGFRINYFEALFIRFRFDGEHRRLSLCFDLSALFNGAVHVRITERLDTREKFNKNARNFRNVIACGPLVNAALLAVLIIVNAVFLTFGIPSGFVLPVMLALAVSSWFMLYRALTEDFKRRGDALAYFRCGADSDELLLLVAAQRLVELPDGANLDEDFLTREAQRIIDERIESGRGTANRRVFNIAGYLYLKDALGEVSLSPVIADFIDGELLTDALFKKEPVFSALTLSKIRMFVCARIIYESYASALSALDLAARLASASRAYGMNAEFKTYIADACAVLRPGGALTETEADILSQTDFLPRDAYGGLFTGYAALIERADDAAHQRLFYR